MSKTGEHEIALAVMRIAAGQKDRIASFARIKTDLPNFLNLTEDDCQESLTRKGEPMWHQIVRNIRSHYTAEGNVIEMGYLEHIPRVGYRITNLGMRRLGINTA